MDSQDFSLLLVCQGKARQPLPQSGHSAGKTEVFREKVFLKVRNGVKCDLETDPMARMEIQSAFQKDKRFHIKNDRVKTESNN